MHKIKASHKEQINSNKKHLKAKSRSRSRTKLGGKKLYKTDIESDEPESLEDMDMEMEDGEKADEVRYGNEKNFNCILLKRENFAKMKYMLDIGFNLLIYGVGSKHDITNLFVQDKLIKGANPRRVLMFNGYLSQVECSMKGLLKEVRGYLLSEVYRQ